MQVKLKFRTAIYISMSVVFLVVISAFCNLCGVNKLLDRYIDINYFDLLLAQIANTLIVLSLTSVLSSNFGQAYWIDIKETKLISPFLGCFIGITVYLLTALVFSIIAYAAEFHVGIISSSIFATILLIILTFKMISIYFGKEELKKQLLVEYKYMLISYNISYFSDYIRRLERYIKEVEKKEFQGKKRFLKALQEEHQDLMEKDPCSASKKVLDKHMSCLNKVKEIDLKIEEYTINAIINNDAEVVRENIELLVESENYQTFFDLIEDVFNWDDKYACRTLVAISKKNNAWMIKDKLSFFKQYALNKLITQSGKLDVIQNLLMTYDVNNLGMKEIAPQLNVISEDIRTVHQRESELDRELSDAEDYRQCMCNQKEQRKQLREEEELLVQKLLTRLKGAKAKDLRLFYIPIREACVAYDEGKYEIVNKYISVILANYKQDVQLIQLSSGLMDVSANISFTFSYITEEEIYWIHRLIERDKENLAIPEHAKKMLLEMQTVTIDSNPWIGEEALEIFRATLDLPQKD